VFYRVMSQSFFFFLVLGLAVHVGQRASPPLRDAQPAT
jgi:hypothetical protein